MRGLSKCFAVAVISAAFVAPAAAAGFNGGGAPNSGDSGPVLPSPGGGGGIGPHGPSGPGHAPGGAFPPMPNGPNSGYRPSNPGGPNSGYRPPRHDGPPPDFAGQHHDGDDWRRRPRRYWFGGGPIFIPDPSGVYVYGGDDYEDGSDPSGCRVYRKAYDSAGAFLGWIRVDLCEGQ